ncbi:TIGR04283 family arsenosugar biosynthesis glycosyltransferase [Adlercreutzia sp. ZJ141]|uniref:TIGR04283 family arsenosugar biosynthesis glycosyltransferase n=1 Tax=Adlercreutzia sp. ZJ141 TaxID=2709406 RepID=UPI0013EA5C9E|nr:TIGR04283 family arsenosugar biosynthesis glycosyltransferase [Adlercreutzia sp. ZJ141]
MLSIVVPVYNEETALPAFLHMVDSWNYPCEIIFSDGGSTDDTMSLLEGRTVVRGAKGRGGQCRRGVEASQGEHILFLHVDTTINETALQHIQETLDSGASWGCLTVDFTSHRPEYRFGIRKSNLRARVGGIPFGDQGMFMTRAALDRVGGVPDICIMEDYELSRRLRKAFGWPRQLSDRITASVRRFEAGNHTLIGFQMAWLRFRYRRGTSPERIQQLYGDVREKAKRNAVAPKETVAAAAPAAVVSATTAQPTPERAAVKRVAQLVPELSSAALEPSALTQPESRIAGEALVLFTRVPVAGKAKTRLAPTLSPEQCADVQRALIADTVSMLSQLDRDIVVCYAPDHDDQPNGEAIFATFKHSLQCCYTHPTRQLHFIEQRGRTLGARMDAAFEDAFSMGATSCLLMGSDIPNVRVAELNRAFDKLTRRDVVLAPSQDGGYWLVGLRERFPELFADKRYGTDSVFEDAKRTCAEQGRTVAFGPQKLDIDTPSELEWYSLRIKQGDTACRHMAAMLRTLDPLLHRETVAAAASSTRPTNHQGKENVWNASLTQANQAP